MVWSMQAKSQGVVEGEGAAEELRHCISIPLQSQQRRSMEERRSDEAWKNVIKEYNLTGKNCVHYNLPEEQQSAVENYLNIHSYPTYKLIDKQGNIHDLHWLHHEDMKSFLETIDKLSK